MALTSSHSVSAQTRAEFLDKLGEVLTPFEVVSLLVKCHARTSPVGKAKRFGLYPIQDWAAFERTKRLEAAYWQADEVRFSEDLNDFLEFSEEEKRPLIMAFGFFAVGDGSIINMLALRMFLLQQALEKQGFYIVQINNERVHAETYGKMIYSLVRDSKQREEILEAVEKVKSIKAMNEYIEQLFEDPTDPSLRHAYVCLSIAEFIMFVPLFCIIFWYRAYRPNKIKSIIETNQLVAQDEAGHGQNGCDNYNSLPINERYTEEEIHALMDKGVKLVSNFADEVLTEVNLPELTAANVKQYIRFVADDVLERLKYPPMYKVQSPFSWMTLTNIIPKENFYELDVTQYGRFNVREAIEKARELHSTVVNKSVNPYKSEVRF